MGLDYVQLHPTSAMISIALDPEIINNQHDASMMYKLLKVLL